MFILGFQRKHQFASKKITKISVEVRVDNFVFQISVHVWKNFNTYSLSVEKLFNFRLYLAKKIPNFSAAFPKLKFFRLRSLVH